MSRATPFLMFQGRCEEALRFYEATLPDTRIEQLTHHGADGPGVPGTVFLARLRLAGQTVMANDSPPVHDFGFTPSFSFWIDCAAPAEVDHLAAALGADGGGVMMPPGDYGFAERFAFVADRFGVSFQLCHGHAWPQSREDA
ncbi:VOC family protein [Aurantimonas sp. HBX-1]|uniref:VOC family protein n=1 Tax=Aurantimonas sp. HBX-1 TaxID=2906072 RepID=UPI001F23BADF|nr:VOC family protein [Aurantimonas sp. HBX-1]UIJ70730.1 VOC family protein [Aurantimonas sp. HBX-1]